MVIPFLPGVSPVLQRLNMFCSTDAETLPIWLLKTTLTANLLTLVKIRNALLNTGMLPDN